MIKLFTKYQVKFLIAIGFAMGFRELSMTMLNPFISIYGSSLIGNTAFLSGLALGIYGLTNAIFQIPYGMISDRIGRKPILIIGLFQLLIGLILAGLAKNIYLLVFARAIQGSGAIMSAAYSWVGDSIEYSKKNRAMGIVGAIDAIGAVLAFLLGPILYNFISVSTMFFGASILIFLSILFLCFFIKETRVKLIIKPNKNGVDLKITDLFKNKLVMFVSFGAFIFNYIMAEMFMIVPELLKPKIGVSNMWYVFLPSIILGIASIKISSHLADNNKFTQVSIVSFLFLGIGIMLILPKTLISIFIGTILIFCGYMSLTSVLPSSINKSINKNQRGAANGIFQTMFFLGFFLGPTLTGLLLGYNYINIIFIIPIFMAIIGAVLIINLNYND